MIKESQPIEKQPGIELSSKDYREIGHQLLKVDKGMARTYFKQAGLSDEEIRQFFAETAAAEKEVPKKEPKMLPDDEKKELFEKIAAEFDDKFEKTGQAEYQDLAKTYRRQVEKLAKES